MTGYNDPLGASEYRNMAEYRRKSERRAEAEVDDRVADPNGMTGRVSEVSDNGEMARVEYDSGYEEWIPRAWLTVTGGA